MQYILEIGNQLYFQRRVPVEYRAFDARKKIRYSLKTDSRKEAVRLASLHNKELENYWEELAKTGTTHHETAYEAAVKRARTLGYGYAPSADLAVAGFKELYARLVHAEKEKYLQPHVEAVLGGIEKPQLKVSDAAQKYFAFTKDIEAAKSPNQYRKWRRPRERAVENFIVAVEEDKVVSELTRDDLLKFKLWWQNRLHVENLGVNSANKNFIQLKVILDTINDSMNLGIDIDKIFKKILIKEDHEQTRLPFDTEYIQDVLLNPINLEGLNEQAKQTLYVFAETGCGPSEITGLQQEDIVLDAIIPHIIIRPKTKKGLKTRYRKRIIPLVGYALNAFKKFPQGFTEYWDKPDRLSAVLSKFLHENNLFPSPNHTTYSLRHSLQDRLLAVNAPDRVQADLMGHKFSRQAYGKGSSLEQKAEWMDKIKLTV